MLSHIDVELSGEPEPVPAHRLLKVLDRLGEPQEWVPQERSSWQRPFAALQSQAGDWRLSLLAFGFLALAFILMLGSVMLWPMPLVLGAVSFVTARIAVGLLDGGGEPIGVSADPGGSVRIDPGNRPVVTNIAVVGLVSHAYAAQRWEMVPGGNLPWWMETEKWDDLQLTWTPDQPPGAGGAPGDSPPLFTAVQDQLGLRLEPSQAPVEVLVIRSAERPTKD